MEILSRIFENDVILSLYKGNKLQKNTLRFIAKVLLKQRNACIISASKYITLAAMLMSSLKEKLNGKN